jgi:DNA-directed RNA polymerase subunit alpha
MDQQLSIKCVNTTTDSDGSIYGKFVMEPLNQGYGTTVGNSLRRVLLSSLKGCAITSVRVEGITHEYTTVPGVVEDVLNIMLNLKGVVLKSSLDEEQVLRLDMSRPGPITAGDIECPPSVKIINPDWHICTINDGGSIRAEMTCNVGVGYAPADQAAATQRSVDTLAIDAVYMPIRRVAYNVEDTRVGQHTDYDKLTLELWSNGSMDVSAAISEAANQIIEHMVPIASLAGVPAVVSHVMTEEVELTNSVGVSIEDLELSVRAFNCLKRANIHSMDQLLLKSEADLLNIKNFGKKSSDEVIERLTAFNLNLKPNPEDYEVPVDV